jgi:hypothetical protein
MESGARPRAGSHGQGAVGRGHRNEGAVATNWTGKSSHFFWGNVDSARMQIHDLINCHRRPRVAPYRRPPSPRLRNRQSGKETTRAIRRYSCCA